MTFLTLSLFSFLACGDKPLTGDTAENSNNNNPTTNPDNPTSSPTDDPVIEEELEPLEVVAVGFEFLGTWDQSASTLGGWTLDDSTPQDHFMLVHFTNMDFFSVGAGDDDENICTFYARFVNQAAVLDAQEYPWDNPPSNAGMYPLDGVSATTWAGFEGYITFDGTTSTPDSCGRIIDERVITVNDEGLIIFPMEGMHFGLSYGPLTEQHETRLSEAYADSDIGDYFEDNKEAFVSQYIHINHQDSSSDEGYDFTGYDWNYARLAGLNEDETIATIPCDWDEELDCYDLIPYDGLQNVLSLSDAFWYEDFPNIDFDILQLGVPEITEPTEPEPADAHIRVVHLSPDAPEVDVYVDGTALPGSLSFPTGSEYLTVPAAEYTFEVAPTGTSYEDVLSVGLTATLEAGVSYTAIAHGYLDSSNSNGFAITPFVTDRSEVAEGTFRLQVVHAAAADAFAQVDVWNITDADNPAALIEDFDYGASVTTELPTGVAFVLGVDVDNDANPEATFNIPDSLTGVVSVYAVNDTDGVPFLFAHLDDGTTIQIDAE